MMCRLRTHEHTAAPTSKRREQFTFIDNLTILPLRKQPFVPRSLIGKQGPGDGGKLFFDNAHQLLSVLETRFELLYRRQIGIVESFEGMQRVDLSIDHLADEACDQRFMFGPIALLLICCCLPYPYQQRAMLGQAL